MAREKFREARFKPARLALISRINAILTEYVAQGLVLTLRQLHYQMVVRFPDKGDGEVVYLNNQKSYAHLGKTLSEARLAGMVDWDAIEDRGRQPSRHSQWASISDLVDSAIRGFRLPRWEGQTHHVELWVEKDALAGVLEPLANEFHATLMVNKGYSSQSAMYAASKRYLYHQNKRKNLVLFYLGDHDPSGEDMVRDIEDRLTMFGVKNLEVRKLALTPAQIQQYDPPPNPVKFTDSRSAKYQSEHGDECWEVDALEPRILQQIIRTAFESVVNQPLMNRIKAKEVDLRKKLKLATIKIDGGDEDDLCQRCETYNREDGEELCEQCIHEAAEDEDEDA